MLVNQSWQILLTWGLLIGLGTGQYTYAWFGAAAMCTIAAVISATIHKHAVPREPAQAGVPS